MSYFSRIAARSLGTIPKVGLKPAKASRWPGLQPVGIDGLEGDGSVAAAQWPDASSVQTPIAPTVAPRTQVITTQVQETSPAPQRQPETAAFSPTPPPNPHMGTANATPLQPEVNPLETFYGSISTPKPITPKPQVPQAETPEAEAPLSPTPKNQRIAPEPPTILPKTLRVQAMSEGLIEQLPQQKPIAQQVPPPQRLMPDPIAIGSEKSTPESRKAEAVPPPKTQQMTPPPAPPQAESKPRALTPFLPNPANAPAPPIHKITAPKTELVIGKLTVEVIESSKPVQVVQAPPAPPRPQSGSAKSASHPVSILQYGLGQL